MSNNFKESFSGDLPREEFEKSGGNAAALTSEKLLAILLKTGAQGCNVMELSHRLVSAFGGTGHLVRANFIQLKEQIGRYNKLHPLTDPLVITRGTMNGTMVHPREVFQEAVRWGAHAVMVAHNHPSGDPEPSGKDIELTRRLIEVSKVMAIPLYDHIVLGAVGSAGGKGYVSFRDRRLVDFER